ncbi:MAG: hypothetical protein WBE91_15415 [Steroidobacteraceae bacterium]
MSAKPIRAAEAPSPSLDSVIKAALPEKVSVTVEPATPNDLSPLLSPARLLRVAIAAYDDQCESWSDTDDVLEVARLARD